VKLKTGDDYRCENLVTWAGQGMVPTGHTRKDVELDADFVEK
jgi:hypothetical protein